MKARGAFYQAASARVLAVATSVAAGILSIKLYGKFLTPQSYGPVVLALQVLAYLPLIDGGIRTVVNRAILVNSADPTERSRLLEFAQGFYTWYGLGVLLLSVLGMSLYALTGKAAESAQSWPFFAALGLMFGLSMINQIQSSALIALEAQGPLYLIQTVGNIVNVLSLWYFLSAKLGLWAFPLSMAVTVGITYPITIVVMKQKAPGLRLFRFDWGEAFKTKLNQLRTTAWFAFQSQLFTTFLFSFEIVMVGLFCDAASTAVYAVLIRCCTIARTLLQAVPEALWPYVAQHGKMDQRLYKNIARLSSFAYGTSAVGICYFIIPVISWYMGREWAPDRMIVLLVAARYLVTGIASVATYLLYGMGKFEIIRSYLALELVVALILSAIGGALFGGVGVAGGFLFSTVCGTLYPFYRAYAREFQQSARQIICDFWVCAVVGGAVTWLVRSAGRGRLWP